MTATIKANSPASDVLYERDIVAWAEQQAFLLRAGRFAELDIENIAEEIEDVGKSERRELANRMAVLLAHLLKWRHQPERQSSSWQATIRHQRERISRRLARTPSLKACLADPDWWLDAWGDARMETAEDTGIGFDAFPLDCPWTLAEILDPSYWPDGP
jgi:hypothetical protein